MTLLDVHFLSYPSLEDWIKGSKYLRQTIETSPQTPTEPQSSLNATEMKEIVCIDAAVGSYD